jgi:N-terminal domain of NWD NACHT-NTPase
MKWYSNLSKLLFEETFEQDERLAELRSLLGDQILSLYEVLKYVMKRICAYDRNPALRVLREVRVMPRRGISSTAAKISWQGERN